MSFLVLVNQKHSACDHQHSSHCHDPNSHVDCSFKDLKGLKRGINAMIFGDVFGIDRSDRKFRSQTEHRIPALEIMSWFYSPFSDLLGHSSQPATKQSSIATNIMNLDLYANCAKNSVGTAATMTNLTTSISSLASKFRLDSENNSPMEFLLSVGEY